MPCCRGLKNSTIGQKPNENHLKILSLEDNEFPSNFKILPDAANVLIVKFKQLQLPYYWVDPNEI